MNEYLFIFLLIELIQLFSNKEKFSIFKYSFLQQNDISTGRSSYMP